jgi:hypothetical protein
MCRTRVWWLARSSASSVETPKRGKELGEEIVGSEGAKPSLWSIIYRMKSRVLESPPLPQRLLQAVRSVLTPMLSRHRRAAFPSLWR